MNTSLICMEYNSLFLHPSAIKLLSPKCKFLTHHMLYMGLLLSLSVGRQNAVKDKQYSDQKKQGSPKHYSTQTHYRQGELRVYRLAVASHFIHIKN